MSKDARRTTAEGPTGPISTVPHQNVRTVLELERSELNRRSLIERLTDAVSAGVSSHGFVILHVVWFASWIAANQMVTTPFDVSPAPCPAHSPLAASGNRRTNEQAN